MIPNLSRYVEAAGFIAAATPHQRARAVQEPLGHADIRMTLRYSHLSPAHLLDAVEKLMPEGTGTTTGTSESRAETAQPKSRVKKRTSSGTPRATRRSRTGDL